jgi:hypothetical protein
MRRLLWYGNSSGSDRNPNSLDNPVYLSFQSYGTYCQHLMKEFIAHGYFRKEAQMLNECWKYLHVMTLAEIYSADSIYLEAWAWNGTGTSDLINHYQWPRQHLLQPLVTGYSGNKLYRPCFYTRPLPRKESSDNPWDPGTQIFRLNGIGCTQRRRKGCTILKVEVGGFSRRFRHVYNDYALFAFSVRNISPLLLRLMAFWLQSLGQGTVSGSRVLIPFHLGLLTKREQPHAISARHWSDLRKKLDKWSVQSVDVVDNGRSIAAAII